MSFLKIFFICLLLIILIILLYIFKDNIKAFISGIFISISLFFGYLFNKKEINQYGGIQTKNYNISTKKIFSVTEPTCISFIDENNILITSRLGKLFKYFKNNNSEEKWSSEIVIDLSQNKNFINNDTELGLLSVVYEKERDSIIISYTIKNNDKDFKIKLIIERIYLKNNKNETIIDIPFRETYHHAGTLWLLNPNELLLSTGDGGPQGDPFNEGQNLEHLYGKLLKINLEHIPTKDNGHSENKQIKVLAYGLRNPWKYSVDKSQRIWIGDVGWNSFESVKLIKDNSKLYNFGWSVYEGNKKIKNKTFDYEKPIFEYPTSDEFGRSIIGGYFIQDKYIFSDFLGFIKIIQYDSENKKWIQVAQTKIDEKIYTMGLFEDKIYIGTKKSLLLLSIN